MIALLSLLIAAGVAEPASRAVAPPPPPAAPGVVTVVGVNPRKVKQDLADCLAHACTPADDLRLSLAAAEADFDAGDYRSAHNFLSASLDRNHGYMAELPILEAGLYRADSRVLKDMGEGKMALHASYQIANAMKAGFPASSPQVLSARLEAADALAHLGDIHDTTLAYTSLRTDAVAAHDQALADAVTLRLAVVYTARGDKTPARRTLDEMVANPAASTAAKLAAQVLIVRMSGAQDPKAVEALLAAYKASNLAAAQPILVFSPVVDLHESAQPRTDASGVMTHREPLVSDDPRPIWADIGFWITPEGTVEDADVIRSVGNKDWQKLVLDAVRQRRYAPQNGGDASARSYHIDRYTLAAYKNDRPGTGSLIIQRSPLRTLEVVDMTPVAAADASSAALPTKP